VKPALLRSAERIKPRSVATHRGGLSSWLRTGAYTALPFPAQLVFALEALSRDEWRRRRRRERLVTSTSVASSAASRAALTAGVGVDSDAEGARWVGGRSGGVGLKPCASWVAMIALGMEQGGWAAGLEAWARRGGSGRSGAGRPTEFTG
jgi:hypothetical protein